jgi:Lar family restriction alleviation protein
MKLKPCPFCGGKAKYQEVPADSPDNPWAGGEFIECKRCKASTSLMFPLMDSVKELVIEKWNQRHDGKKEGKEQESKGAESQDKDSLE